MIVRATIPNTLIEGRNIDVQSMNKGLDIRAMGNKRTSASLSASSLNGG